MNITEAKEKISLLYEKAINITAVSPVLHPVRIIQASKSIIGINKDNPIGELLVFNEEYIDGFAFEDVKYKIDESSIAEMVSYKSLEEALVNGNAPMAQQKLYELSRVSEGMQIIEFLLEYSLRYTKESFLLIWSIYRMMLFLDKKFMLQSLLLCVDSILSSKDVSENEFLFKDAESSFKFLNRKKYEKFSVLCQIYFSDLVRKEKILDAMSKFVSFNDVVNEKYNGSYESRMKLWLYLSERRCGKLSYQMILDVDAIRGMMKVVDDNKLYPYDLYKYTKKILDY